MLVPRLEIQLCVYHPENLRHFYFVVLSEIFRKNDDLEFSNRHYLAINKNRIFCAMFHLGGFNINAGNKLSKRIFLHVLHINFGSQEIPSLIPSNMTETNIAAFNVLKRVSGGLIKGICGDSVISMKYYCPSKTTY